MVHLRSFYRPTQTWAKEERKWTRPRPTTTAPIVTPKNVSISTSSKLSASISPDAVPSSIPYADLTVGIVRETYPNERRVAITPQNAALLLKKGFGRILVEHGAGAEAQFTDHAYEQAGVKLVDGKTVWSESDILLKVRAPSIDGPNNEVDALHEGGMIISFLYPLQNRNIVEKIAARGATAFAMDMIPRISRAQVFDALRYVWPLEKSHELRFAHHGVSPVQWPILRVIRLF